MGGVEEHLRLGGREFTGLYVSPYLVDESAHLTGEGVEFAGVEALGRVIELRDQSLGGVTISIID